MWKLSSEMLLLLSPLTLSRFVAIGSLLPTRLRFLMVATCAQIKRLSSIKNTKKMPFDSGKWKCLCFVSAYGNGNKIATWNLRACWSTIQWTSVNKLMWKLVLWEKLNSFSYSGWGHAAHWENIVQARERKLWTDWKCILDCITKNPQGKMVCRIASN